MKEIMERKNEIRKMMKKNDIMRKNMELDRNN